jgi:hypothetical protein
MTHDPTLVHSDYRSNEPCLKDGEQTEENDVGRVRMPLHPDEEERDERTDHWNPHEPSVGLQERRWTWKGKNHGNDGCHYNLAK